MATEAPAAPLTLRGLPAASRLKSQGLPTGTRTRGAACCATTKERRNAGLTGSTVPCYRERLFWAQCTYWAPGAAGGSQACVRQAGLLGNQGRLGDQAPVEGAFGDHGPDETGCPRSAPA